jgi:sugar-specific transcriptional regulator TrmB
MQDSAVKTLVDLGLSVLQAKAYIALATSRTLPGRAVAKIAKIAPQDIYRLMNELTDQGLVQKIVSKPTKYNALPLDEGLNLLLKRRREHTEKLEKDAELLAKEAKVYETIEEETNEFVIIPNRESIDKMTEKMFRTAKKSIDVINDAEDVPELQAIHKESEKQAIRNGVKTRFLLGKKTDNIELPMRFLNFAKKNELVEVKTIDGPAPAKLMIKDGKEAFVATKVNAGTPSQTFLWINNPVMAQIIQQWYNSVWSTANKASSGKRINLHIHR